MKRSGGETLLPLWSTLPVSDTKVPPPDTEPFREEELEGTPDAEEFITYDGFPIVLVVR